MCSFIYLHLFRVKGMVLESTILAGDEPPFRASESNQMEKRLEFQRPQAAVFLMNKEDDAGAS